MHSCTMVPYVVVLAVCVVVISAGAIADIKYSLGSGKMEGLSKGSRFGEWEAISDGGGADLNSIRHFESGLAWNRGIDLGGYDEGHDSYSGGNHGGYSDGGNGVHGGYSDFDAFGGFYLGGVGGGHSLENELAAHEDQAALSAVGLANLLTGGGLGGGHAHLASSGSTSYMISGPTQEIKSLHKIQTTSEGGHVISRTAGHEAGGKAIILIKQPVIASLHESGHGWH